MHLYFMVQEISQKLSGDGPGSETNDKSESEKDAGQDAAKADEKKEGDDDKKEDADEN